MISEEEKKLILDVATKSISPEEFRGAYPVNLQGNSAYIVTLLEEIMLCKDAELLEYALILECYVEDQKDKVNDVLRQIAFGEWHKQHEVIMISLENSGKSEDVDCIYHIATTHHDSLDDDDNENLSVQCTWALRKINTPEAKAKLELLAQSDNERVRSEAFERLKSME